MSKLEEGMVFPNLKQAFEFLDIESEFYGQCKNKEIKLSEFCEWHRLNKRSLIIDKVFDTRKNLYKKQRTYNEKDLEDNFINLYNKFGRVLTYEEFIKNTEISLTTYCNKLNLKGRVYDTLIEKYLSKEVMELYRNNMINLQRNRAKARHYNKKYSDKDLEDNFKNVFNKYYNNYGTFPTRRIFNKISKIDESTYRKYYSLKWSELCEKYGYQNLPKYKSEYLALEICKSIFHCKYIPQKTFDWLINDSNHHLFCDGYFPKINLVIEFDGSGHRKNIKCWNNLERQIYNDKIKDDLLNKHQIKIIRIDSRLEWYTEKGMRNIINSELKKYNMNISEIIKLVNLEELKNDTEM